jgi:formylglycine-generating enzyme required for sulfatase activity
MPEKKSPPQEINTGPAEEDRVILKPLFGIRPGVYLAGLYGFLLLLILFFIFFYPGLSNPGSVLEIKTEPRGAAVRVDGVYMDAAPCGIFVKKGRRQIEITLPGFSPWRTEMEVPGRTFASALFPLKVSLEAKLGVPNPSAAFVTEAGDYAAWSFTGEPTAAYQVPLSLSEGAYRLGPAASEPAIRTSMETTLAASARFAVTRSALRDLLRAKFLLDNQGLSPSPLTLLGSAGDILAFLGENPGAAPWLAGILQGEAAAAVAGSSWYEREISGAVRPTVNAPGGTFYRLPLTLGGLGFVEIPGGSMVRGGAFPHTVKVETFSIAETEITRAAWDSFLRERPEWGPENIESLIERGLVSREYLKAEDFPGVPSREGPAAPVSGISWYAAQAFCQWLSSRLNPEFADWEIRLPTETQWEYAAKSGLETALIGGYWEWCADPFAPLDFFPSAPETLDPGSPERAVRGGSWLNPPGSVGPETRGSLPPDSCSPFVSFRPALIPKKD